MDFDDFIMTLPGFEYLQKIKEHIPQFKCTLFTPAFNLKLFTKEVSISKFKQWAKLVNENKDWIEIAYHGFSHIRGELMETDKKKIEILVKACENLFGQMEMKPVKVFKAPFWEISKEAEEVLKERGYVLAIDRNNPVVHTDIPVYVFNWSINEPIPKCHLVRGHGHLYGTPNGLDRCFSNVMKIPSNSKFLFISEYLWKNTNQE